jgi:hypothetical protein
MPRVSVNWNIKIETLENKDMDSNLPRIAADLKLGRIAGSIPFACVFIVINEFCERLAYYGGTAMFQNYVQKPSPTGALVIKINEESGPFAGYNVVELLHFHRLHFSLTRCLLC